jgi:hypothetical protein
MDTPQNPMGDLDEPPRVIAPAPPQPPPVQPPSPPALPEPRGCLYALSQPPLMLFLAVIAILLAVTGGHDLFML